MATIGQTYPQLIDMHKSSTPGMVIDVLRHSTPVLDDAIARQCNMGGVERSSIMSGYPDAAWGKLYKGVKKSKSTMQQVDDTTGFLEARSEIDTRLLKLAKDPAKQRLIDSGPFIRKMGMDMETGIFYNDVVTTPERFKGLAPRYSSYYAGANLDAPKNSAAQVVHGGGAGNDNTSIWFVTWGDHATSLLYPENTTAGVTMIDRGEEKTEDGNGDPFYVKAATYEWHIGLTVKDWRYNARICNIDTSNMLAGSVDLWALLRKAYYRLESRQRDAVSSRIAIYMNSDVLEVLDAQSSDRALLAANTNTVNLGHAQVEGKEVRTYRGIPIRETKALIGTEALVPAYA